MSDSLQRSIDRAAVLLGAALRSQNYVSVKLVPADPGCCCFHCWPRTWEAVNLQYARKEPMKDEGDLLIESETGTRLVLECHESGPEIIAYVVAGVGLAKAITEVVLFLLRARQRDTRSSDRLRVIVRRATRAGAVEEEESLDVSLPLTDATEKLISEVVRRRIETPPLGPVADAGPGRGPEAHDDNRRPMPSTRRLRDRARRLIGGIIGRSADSAESAAGPPEFTPDRAAEIRERLDQLSNASPEETRRLRRQLRRRGFYISEFPDVVDWSARAFDRLVKDVRVIVREAENEAR